MREQTVRRNGPGSCMAHQAQGEGMAGSAAVHAQPELPPPSSLHVAPPPSRCVGESKRQTVRPTDRPTGRETPVMIYPLRTDSL